MTTYDYPAELKDLIESLIRENASDLHISTGRTPFLRVSGDLLPLTSHRVYTKEDTMALLQLMIIPSKLEAFKNGDEVDFSYDFEGRVRLRGNAFLQKNSASIALRAIQKVKSLKELNLPEQLVQFARKRQGFFLVVGPVGSGKSTTLAALINMINKERREHIVTIEDPMEYAFEEEHSVIDQREIGIDSKDFESALKSVFRQDVNVIMIGEMRSPETMVTAVTAAETGHLVLSTLHTNTASQSIDRIIDSFPPNQQDQIRAQLSSTLLGIFSQRLIPGVSGGVVPAYELLINNSAVANLIREGRTHELDTVIETGLEVGMIDMNRSLLDLVRNQKITLENAYRYSTNPKALERLL
ncbi:MAG: PilT/PilU family type 4a pilus ATPase [Candidatus Pacebacteria bacterium]|nr:PilT/PilU family type 4a pilus ATPase [Candidatus Paceibacterota bacterium]